MQNFKKTILIASTVAALLCTSGCTISGGGERTVKPSSPVSQVSSTTTVATTATTSPSSTTTSSTTTSTTTTSSSASAKPSKKYEYSYAGFNPDVTDMNVDFNLILLNRNYRLPNGYTPKLSPAISGSDIKLDYRVAPHYQRMYNAARANGITLKPVSGYRSFAKQKSNFENRIKMYMKDGLNKVDATVKASRIVLLPGTSEHNAGLAMDICSLKVSFENTKEFAWLQEHAHEYGFIMRYPKDKTHITNITYEPWHYRYVGVEVAAKLKESGQVLEEYLGKV